MQNNTSFKLAELLPVLGILLIFGLQHYHAYRNLQMSDELANEQLANLKADMREDNVPPNIEGHILTVARNTAFQMRLELDSMSGMTLFFQANILLMVYLFYSLQNRKTKGSFY